MNMSRVIRIAFLSVLYFGNAGAQGLQLISDAAKREVAEDVKQAAKLAHVPVDSRISTGFVDAASSQPDVFSNVYSTVGRTTRVRRLAGYLSAKAEAKEGYPNVSLGASDLVDFHWGYMAHDTRFVPMRFESSSVANLLSLESAGRHYAFGARRADIKSGSVILFPDRLDKASTKYTATFDLKDGKATWTGSPSAEGIYVATAATTKGCEIFVNSTPKGATVQFNRRTWYAQTDTSSVRDPGNWEVTIRLTDHLEWREQRFLGPGETWTINALLLKEKKPN